MGALKNAKFYSEAFLVLKAEFFQGKFPAPAGKTSLSTLCISAPKKHPDNAIPIFPEFLKILPSILITTMTALDFRISTWTKVVSPKIIRR